ncbi:LytTR family DNA-binding domain-containing protein [uncultured Tenacibaculum sp.]|uniref:LytR/AlgR family response regulator transcription factor n=1 Tax=uncultured Tenacibaculum sp. TaxID=174713 RepID=UPI0026383CF6|nr:LytTR family DNA-binding domain-containing protein [uncultured Tenacibaculum sp.]
MRKINCLIVDDEPIARQGIKEYCDQISILNVVALCKNAIIANEHLQSHEIDLVFLDINMPLITGLEWLKTLQKSPLVVITSAYSEHALESFDFDVIDYLVKPIPFDRFLKAVNKAERLLNSKDTVENLFIKTSNSIKKITVADILFLESMQNYVKIITKEEVIVSHSTLKQMLEQLPEDLFIQTHKSYVVAKDKVNEIVGNQILIYQHKIPISVRLKKEVVTKLMQ